MNTLKGYGSAIYGITVLAALLCGFLVSLTLVAGFAYAGVMGDAPGDQGYQLYTSVATTGFIGTAILFIGVLGVSSQPRAFPLFTIVAMLYYFVFSSHMLHGAFAARHFFGY